MPVQDKSRWQQERERFQLPNPDPEPPESAGPIRQTILNIFSRMNTGEPSLWRRVAAEWEDLAGAAIARHARPVRLERKMLVVAVDSAVWMNELIRYERAPLLARLQAKYGADRIKVLHFQADPRAAAAGAATAPERS